MVGLYVTLIINHKRSFDDISERFKEEVRAELKRLGFNEEGNPET